MKKVTFTAFGNIEFIVDAKEFHSFFKKIPTATTINKPRLRVFWRDKTSNGYRGGYGELFADRHHANDLYHSDICVHFFAPVQGLGTRTISEKQFYDLTVGLWWRNTAAALGLNKV